MIGETRPTVGGYRTRCLEVEGPRPEHPVLFVHGNPNSADEWRPFLDRLEGRRRCLAFDLIGWGQSERRKDLDHTADTLAWFVKEFIDAMALERFDLVVHDWGSIALVPASWRPESVGRIVAMNTATLWDQYRWHWVARLWQTPVVGELLNATTTRFGTLQILRQATPRPGSLPEVADDIHRHLDGTTKRAILELYRSAPPEKLGQLGSRLGAITAPALVLWGDKDPYTQPRFGDYYKDALGGEVRVEHLPDAGHWVWLDRPDVVAKVAAFLSADDPGG
jgi:pimeloyl-ACP methyl ester carboxylesterase